MSISQRSSASRQVVHGIRLLPWLFQVCICALFLSGGGGQLLAQPASGLLREVFEGIPGVSVSDLTNAGIYPNSPTSTGYITNYFEAPTDVLENYGQRVRGYLVPPVTGNYTFWIASDDGSELWLSTDETVAKRQKVATVNSWTASREWTKEANQQSAPIPLKAGQSYYVEALMKEGGGGDNLAVRWLRPDGVDEGPIPGKWLVPWGVVFKAPAIVRQPQNTTAMEGLTARFDIQLDPLSPSQFQWRRNGVDLPGATNSVLEYAPVRLVDQNANFTVFLTNKFGSATSSAGVLTVTMDATPPQLVRAENRSARTVRVRFTEMLDPVEAQNAANYQISGGITVESAALESDAQSAILTVSPLTFGTRYTLTVQKVTDRAGTPNTIASNSSVVFLALEYTPSDVGSPALAGSVERVGPGQFDVTGGGADVGSTSDQFQFASEQRTGDFDIQVRVADVTVSDPFLHAGLMARENLQAGSRFAAVFASSVQMGSFFESRTQAGVASTQATLTGGYPAAYPQAWLRLRRVGSVFTGFASFDGKAWTQLGSSTISGMPSTLYFGLAVSSHDTRRTATAQFRDLGAVVSTSLTSFTWDREPLGPFVRSTGLVISELMYHPRENDSGRDLEFIELYNAGSIFEDLSGFRLTGDVEYVFPEGFQLQAGEFVVVAAQPKDIQAVYGIPNVLGPYAQHLSNSGGAVTLKGRFGDILLTVEYETVAPWPLAADGAGHSLTLARPSYGPSDPRAWAASRQPGGTPGKPEGMAADPLAGVMINELLAHTDDPQLDFVEIYNRNSSESNAELNLGGCYLTDSLLTNRFRFPDGFKIPARGYQVLDQNQLGFRLSAAGETLYLLDPTGLRVLDVVRFGAQENGVSWGRQPDGAPTFRRLSQPTPGAANATWRAEEIVIHELMYHPISDLDDDEYLELMNRSTANVDLSGWRFTSGIDFRIPEGTQLKPGGYLVVAKNPERLRSHYSHLNVTNTVGGYSGTLSNKGERVALARPDDLLTTNTLGVVTRERIWIDVAEVTYAVGGQWGSLSEGAGSSLELIDPHADPSKGPNWMDSDETSKGEWTTVSVTGRLDNGNGSFPPDQLQITLQGGGEALVDEVKVVRQGATQNLVSNSGFETGSGQTATGWTFQGNHTESYVQSGGADVGNRCLHVKTSARGDTGYNRIRTPLAAGLADGNTATISARVRWVSGWPEMLFRRRRNWLELPARLTVPQNLGTPGLPNSRGVANAGPSIVDVSHTPALPAANQAIVVTARVADPDGVSSVRLTGRVDGTTTAVTVVMRDDGAGGDLVPGDGIYSGTVTGRGAGTLIAFRVESTDSATTAATARYPADGSGHECLVRWGDPVPMGTLGHYHMWNTAAVENARNQSSALNNLYRDLTFVYGGNRVIYAAGFKDKGSPFKGGAGDWYVSLPQDQPLLGTSELALASTGNNGGDGTNLREQVCFSIARGLGAAYLHRRYIRLYRNGSLFRDVMEDTEEPNGQYAARFTSEGDRPDLYKIEDWFEFQDDGTSFGSVDATLQRFTTPPGVATGPLKPARYRWSWRKRAVGTSANDMTNLLALVETVNTTGTSYVSQVFRNIDVDEWMRVFAFERIVGNWDCYGMGRGKNMYAYKRDGALWKLLPWDVDFALDNGGNSPSDALWGAGDPTINVMFDNPAIRRRLWQAYIDAVKGPLLPERVAAQAESRASVLIQNGVPSTSNQGAQTYLATRRQTIQNAIQAADVPALEITTNNGRDLTTTSPSVSLAGKAPLALAVLTVNGVPYPVTWTGFTQWQMTIPLLSRTNVLVIAGEDRLGQPIAGVSDTLTVINNGELPQPEKSVVFNEIQYNPAAPNASFIELLNTSGSMPVDLSGHRVEGVGFTFPEGSILPANGIWILARNAAGFAAAYGTKIPVQGVFAGTLDNLGETLALVRPDPTGGTNEVVLDEVRYASLPPWPVEANGFGPSLQLIDASEDNWRVGNWASAATNAAVMATPGLVNSLRESLEPFPLLWINEVLPVNLSGPTDPQGEHDPYIELYNSGTNTLDLGNFYLTDKADDLTRWRIPNGTTLGPKEFLMIWADGQPDQSTPGVLHAPFRLASTNGFVALTRLQGLAQKAVAMDYLEYGNLVPNRGYGSYPDGDPRKRRILQSVTPGKPNDPAVPEVRVTVNEFVAGNVNGAVDPADGDREDWIELHNAGNSTVDLSGYYLTDDLANWNQFRIPAGYTIPAGGFMVVWADGETGQNSPGQRDLHVNFKLSLSGESIALFDPNGQGVDQITYGQQAEDVAQGRFPDGASGALQVLDAPTPGEPNLIAGGNLPPVLSPIGNRNAVEGAPLTFTAKAIDPDPSQHLTFSLSSDAPEGATVDPATGMFSWTPKESQGPGSYNFAVRVTDDGKPARMTGERITVTVTESNQAPIITPLANLTVDEGSLLTVHVLASDADLPVQVLTYSLGQAPEGVVLDPTTGVLTWTPAEAAGPGTYPITVRVSDGATPPLITEQTFQVTVNEVDNAPVLQPLAPVVVAEGQTLTLTQKAVDPDNPPAALRFSLTAGSPTGVQIDPVTGVLTWPTTEDDGPGTYLIGIRVTQSTGAALSDQYTLGVTVQEQNQAPTLAPISDVTVEEGTLWSLSAKATDPDRPAQALTFALGAGAPSGLVVDSVTGLLSWAVPADMGATTQQITLTVTDNGPAPLSATQTFRLTTRPRFRVAIHEIMSRPTIPGAAYVELANPSSKTPWDLSGLVLQGLELGYTFPAGTVLAPGGFLCVVQDPKIFQTTYGTLPAVVGPWSGTLTLGGEVLQLVRPAAAGAAEQILDEVRFEQGAPWPVAANGSGAALQLVDVLQDNSRVGNWSAAASYNGPRNLVVMTNSWSYYQSGPLDASWKASNFKDAAWPEGRGLLYVENAALPETKSTALTLGQVTYYFRTRFVLPSVPAGAKLVLSTILDDGAVFYLNGQEIHRQNMDPSAVVDFNTLANASVSDAILTGPFTLPADALQVGTNVLAVEVHQINTGSSDIVFGCSLDLEGGSVAAFTPGAANTVAAILPEFPPIYLTEVSLLNTTGPLDSAGERDPWVWVSNLGSTPVDLEGWSLSNSTDRLTAWVFPAGAVVPPGGALRIFADAQPAQGTSVEWHASFRLNPQGGMVLLSRPQPGGVAVVDYMRYTPAPAEPVVTVAPVQPDGKVTLEIRIPVGTEATLESASELGSWALVQVIQGEGVEKPIQVTLTPPIQATSQFWRVKTGP